MFIAINDPIFYFFIYRVKISIIKGSLKNEVGTPLTKTWWYTDIEFNDKELDKEDSESIYGFHSKINRAQFARREGIQLQGHPPGNYKIMIGEKSGRYIPQEIEYEVVDKAIVIEKDMALKLKEN